MKNRDTKTHWTRLITFFAVLIISANITLAQTAVPWSDDFDTYVNGTNLHGINGWAGWDNTPGFAATTTTAQAPSSSVEITGTDDLVMVYTPPTSGQWSVRACQFIPSGLTGQTYFILLNQYAHAGPYNWSTEIQFTGGTMIDDGLVGITQAYIADQWTEIRVEIDLGQDSQQVFYNGLPFYTASWTGHITGGGTPTIGAMDLFSAGASSVFYDNISVNPGVGVSAPCPGGLPVEIGSFETLVQDGVVNLAWTTLSESNNSGFDVEMSSDGSEFMSQAWVEGKGTTTELNSYSIEIADLEPGSYSFRLKQIDYDGAFEYSDVVEAVVTVPEGYLISEAYPNPFNPSTTLEIGVEETQHVSLNVFNSVGQLVASPFAGEIGANQMQTVQVSLDGLPSGQYILAVSGTNWTTHRVVTMTK